MAASLTLEQARIQLNMPFASVSEVLTAAKNAGIEINLTGIQNTANLNDLNGNVGGSLFGAKQQDTQQKTPTTLTQKTNFNFGNTPKFQLNTSTSSQNTSIWGNRTLTGSNQSSSLGNMGLGGSFGKTSGFQLDTPTLNNPTFNPTAQTSLLSLGKTGSAFDNFLLSSMSTFKPISTSVISYSDENQEIDMSKVKTQEFLDNGKMRFTMEDGSVIEKQLSEQSMQAIGTERQLSKIEYVDGQAVYYGLDGQETRRRDVRFGEPGFVSDGNGIQEDLVAVLGEKTITKYGEKQQDYANQLTDINTQLATLTDDYIAQVEAVNPKQAKELRKQREDLQKEQSRIENKAFKAKEKLAAQYIKQVYKECGGDVEKIKAKIDSLIRNSDMSTESAQQMVHILRSFQEKTNGMNPDQIASFFETAMDQALLNGDDNTTALGDEVSRMGGESGQQMLDGYVTGAQRTGRQQVASQALISGVDNAVDPETGEVDTQRATNIGRAVTTLAGDEGAVALGQHVKESESDDLKIATNVAIDEQAARTGNEDVIQTSIDVTTSIKDDKKQVQANENTHQTYEDMGATDETKKRRAEIIGSRIGDFNEDAQLDVDSTERKYDIEDVYLISASQSIQNVNAKVQKEMIERTIASGNEQAMNNIAEHAYDYDISNREDIIRMIKEHGTEGTLKILDEATKKYEAQADSAKAMADAQKAANEAKAEAKPETKTETKTQTQTQPQVTETKTQPKQQQTSTPVANASAQPRTSSTTIGLPFAPRASISAVREMFKSATPAQVVQSEEFKSLSVKESAEVLRTLNASDRKDAIKNIVEGLEGFQLQGYMHSNMKNDILKYLVSNPTGKNQEKLNFVKRFLNGDDKKFIEHLKEQMSTEQQNIQRKPFNFEV